MVTFLALLALGTPIWLILSITGLVYLEGGHWDKEKGYFVNPRLDHSDLVPPTDEEIRRYG